MADAAQYHLPGLRTTFPAPLVAHVELNRPKKYNAFNDESALPSSISLSTSFDKGRSVFHSLAKCFDRLSTDENVRCILLSGVGEHFSAGLDVGVASHSHNAQQAHGESPVTSAASSSGPVSQPNKDDDLARRTWKVRRHVYDYQSGITAVERCEKPVIILCHGVVYGAAIDLALAADIRHCSSDARFSIEEVDVGLAADVGTLSRLPKIGVSYSWAKEVIYTARVFRAGEAERVGLVSKVVEDKGKLIEEGLELAREICEKSPVAMQNSKALFDFSRDRSVQDGLLYTAAWNAAMVQSEDVTKAMMSGMKKTKSNP